VGDRFYVWTEDGLATTASNGVSPAAAEVGDAVFAPAGMRIEWMLGDMLLVVAGMAGTGRVIAVFCDRVEGQDTVYAVVGARALHGDMLDEWRRRLR
jgi:hypothetical protein